MGWFAKRCTEGGTTHNFEPRYNEVPLMESFSGAQGYSAEELRSLFIRKVYVCDVCTWCGRVVTPTETTPASSCGEVVGIPLDDAKE